MTRQRHGESTYVCIQNVQMTGITDSQAGLLMQRTITAAMTRCARQDTVVFDVSIQRTVSQARATVITAFAKIFRSTALTRT